MKSNEADSSNLIKKIFVLIHFNVLNGLFYFRIVYRYEDLEGKLHPSKHNDRIINTNDFQDFRQWLQEFIEFWNIQPIADSMQTAKKVIEVIEKSKTLITWTRAYNIDTKQFTLKEILKARRDKSLDKYIASSDIDNEEFLREKENNPIAKIMKTFGIIVTPSIFDELKFSIYTMERIIDIVEIEGIIITSRQFRYYQKLGLLPKPRISGRNIGTYTLEVPLIIKYIDKFQREGHKIKEIVEIFKSEGLLFRSMASL